MKKLGILFIAMLAVTTMSMAQGFGGGQQMSPEERAKQQTAQIKEAVGLNADQEKKVYDLNVEQGKQRSKMFENMQGGGDMQGMREKMTAMQDDMNKKMKAILTADQYTKYEKWLEDRRSRRGGPGGGGPRN